MRKQMLATWTQRTTAAALFALFIAVTAPAPLFAQKAAASGTPTAIAGSGPVAGTGPVAGSAPAGSATPVAQATAVKTAATAAAGTQAAGAASQPVQAPPDQQSPSAWQYVFLVVAGIAIFYMLLGRPAREEKKRKAMISALKRGDRVVTTSGLLASVVEIKDNEVILKIDESANVKSHYTRSSILSVIEKADAADDK